MTRTLRNRFNAGFSAAEMLVATTLGAIVIGAAALAYSTLMSGQRQYTQVSTVRLPSGALTNFYSLSGTNVSTYMAPNFGSVARAESLREKFIADVEQSIAVYCLYRGTNVFNTTRPATIPSPPYGTVLDTPEAFRAYLATAVPTSATTFASYRCIPLQPSITSATPSFTIFMLGYSANATTIPVLAVYDVDFVQATNPNGTGTVIGTYASVRRYVSGALSAYYDIIYPTAVQKTLTGTTTLTEGWNPPVVAFERRSRLAVTETATPGIFDRFKVAAEQPFYFIFWPDPAEDNLALPLNSSPYVTASAANVLNGSYLATDPRRAYNHMAGRTSFMFTVPMFPSS